MKTAFESGYYESPPSTEFFWYFCLFHRKQWYECPFFFDKTIPQVVQFVKFIFHLAVPPAHISPPEHWQNPKKSVISIIGAFFWKRSNARGKFMKSLHISTIFTTQALMFSKFVNLEKLKLKIWKSRNIGLFWWSV